MKVSFLLLYIVLINFADGAIFDLPEFYNDLEELLLKQMNFSADPCEDFYNYACGTISDGYTTPVYYENERILINGLEELQSSDNNEYLMSSKAINKTVRYYSACVSAAVNASDVTQYTRKTVATFLQTFNFPDANFFFDAIADVNIERKNFSEILRFVHDVFHDEPFFHTDSRDEIEEPLGYLKFDRPMKTFSGNYDCDAHDQLLEKFEGGVRTVMDTLNLSASKYEVKKVAEELLQLEIQLLGLCGDIKGRDKNDDGNDSLSETKSNDKADTNLTSIDHLTFKTWNFDFDHYIKKIVTYGANDHSVDFDHLRVAVNIDGLPNVLKKTDDATLLRYIVFRSVLETTKVPNCTKILTQLPLVKNRIYTETKYSSVMEREALRGLLTNIIVSIKNSLMKMVTSMPWIQKDKKAYKILVKKFNKMKYDVAIESILLNNTWLDEYYEQMQFDVNDGFLDMHSNVLKFASYNKVRLLVFYPPKNIETDTTQINAAYSPVTNKFVVYDGKLIAPFYHSKFPLSYNLGKIGGLIGHEISHSVDSRSINYDDDGSLNPFLSEAAAHEFKEMTDCVIDQYNKIQVIPSNYTPNSVNGTVTLGENMADISGLDAAYRTFKDLQKQYGKERPLRHPKLSGLTHDQIFFLGLGTANCNQYSDDYIHRFLLINDAHAPDKARVLGSLQSLPAFAEAFKCPVGSKYHPAKYCKVWTP